MNRHDRRLLARIERAAARAAVFFDRLNSGELHPRDKKPWGVKKGKSIMNKIGGSATPLPNARWISGL